MTNKQKSQEAIFFGEMQMAAWVKTSVLLDDICPTISASGVSLSIIMPVPSHAEFFQMIRKNYNLTLLGLARRHTRIAERIAAHRQHLAFNLRLKRYGLVPRSLWVRPLVDSQEGKDIARRTSRRFLMARISQNVRTVRELKHDLLSQRRQLAFHMHPSHVEVLKEVRARTQWEKTERCRE